MPEHGHLNGSDAEGRKRVFLDSENGKFPGFPGFWASVEGGEGSQINSLLGAMGLGLRVGWKLHCMPRRSYGMLSEGLFGGWCAMRGGH